jgi:hypothetical protein
MQKFSETELREKIKKDRRHTRSLTGVRDITGLKTRKLSVMWPAGFQQRSDSGGARVMWLCLCECGNFTVQPYSDLRRNRVVSCGCVRRNRESALVNLFSQYRHKAKERGYEWGLNIDEFFELVTSPCHYTGRVPQQEFIPPGKEPSPTLYWNGIDRVDNTKGYIPNNCVSCWGVVNKMKLTMTKEEFIGVCNEVAKMHNRREDNEDGE